MNYFLYDSPVDKKSVRFLNTYSEEKYKVLIPTERCLSFKQMYTWCSTAINLSDEGDTIVCWYDFMGVLSWWLCELRHKKRNIVAVNILLKYKNTAKNRFARFLYKRALKAENFRASVTSLAYGKWLEDKLHMRCNFALVHDIYHDSYDLKRNNEGKEKSVFSGGRNGRDWNLLIRLAKIMPDYQFNLVMNSEQYELLKNNIVGCKNISVKTDTTTSEFIEEICKSNIVTLPVNTEAPAGLTVMFQAAANDKLVITTDTISTEEYITSDRGDLCGTDEFEWKRAIEKAVKEPLQSEEKIYALKKFLQNECSEKAFVQGIDGLVESFKEK